MRGAGRALTGAEVWKWFPHCVRTGPGCRGEVDLGPIWIWKHTVLALLGKNTGAAVVVALKWTEFVVLWQLIWEDTDCAFFKRGPAGWRTWTIRVRCTEWEHKRPLKRLTQRRPIVLAGERKLPFYRLKLQSGHLLLYTPPTRLPTLWEGWYSSSFKTEITATFTFCFTFDCVQDSQLSCQCHCYQWPLAKSEFGYHSPAGVVWNVSVPKTCSCHSNALSYTLNVTLMRRELSITWTDLLSKWFPPETTPTEKFRSVVVTSSGN